MPAEGHVTTGRDDHFERERIYPRDGMVIFRCHGGTGRSLFEVTVGRDGNCSVARRDGTVILRGHGRTGR